MAGGVALGGLTAKAVSAGMSEEDAMLGVIRQVQGLKNADNSLNHAEIAKIRTEIQGLSNDLPVATTKIMEMYEAGGRMNVPREELAQYVKTAAAAATAFDEEDMGGLAENLGRINANFKLTAEQGRELADVINYLDDNAISSGKAIIDYMNRVSGSMGLAKISEKNVAALGSTLLSQGVDDSTAAGAVSALFTRLSTAPDMKPVRKALKDIGLDAKDVQKGMVEDANATLIKIVEAVKKMPKEEQAGILKGLAGGEYNKVFAGLISNTEEWRRQMELANSQDAIGSMAREFETRMGAMSSKWQVFKNQLFNAEAGAGQALFGMLSGLMTTVGGWLNAITRWTAANPQLAAGIMKVVAVGSMLLVGLSGLALVVSTLLVPMVMAKFAILSLGSSALSAFGMLKSGLMILRAAMMANPIVLFVTLAVGALILLWANWDKVKAALIAGWNWLKNVFRQNPLLAAFTGPIGAIVGLIANFDRLKAGLTAGWNWLKNVFRQNPLIAAFTGPIGVIAGLIANFDRLKAAARSAVEWVRRAISGGGATPASVGVPNRGFSVGGYTGAGRSNEAAGIVHKGEVVFSQNDVSRFGGWRIVDALRRGGMAALNWGRGKMGSLQSFVRGSASGLARPSENGRPAPSLVGAVAVPDGFNRSGGGAMPMNISININGGNSSPVDIAKEVARQIEQVARNQARRARSMFADKD
ncbi:phage tail tape measure protein [Neisseria sp. P0019.S002]|uniref:phage tail tape measure protein n=1 Tax=Neisseria sp. P0019.S002 TaxID=3436798 RepID=UPI003F80AE31